MTPKPNVRDLDLRLIDGDLQAAGWNSMPSEVARLLATFWPEVTHDVDGTWHMPEDQATQLNQMFEMFGVALRTDNAPLSALERGYALLVLGMGHFVKMSLRQPEYFERRMARDWPEDWAAWFRAVGRMDVAEARRLAAKLQPLDDDTVYPDKLLTLQRERENQRRLG